MTNEELEAIRGRIQWDDAHLFSGEPLRYGVGELTTAVCHMDTDRKALLAEVERLQPCEPDAQKWRANVGYVAPNPDGTYTISGFNLADAALGALVRQLPVGWSLDHLRDGQTFKQDVAYRWAVRGYDAGSQSYDTPEEALQAAIQILEEMTREAPE